MKARWKRRRTFIINKEFQIPFIIRNLLFLTVIVAIILTVILIWSRVEMQHGVLMRPPSNEAVAEWAIENDIEINSAEYWQAFMVQAKPYTVFSVVIKPLVVVFALVAVLLVLFTIYYTHKIAGPIYRIKKTFKEMKEGKEIVPIKLRKGDFFVDLADILNEAVIEKRGGALSPKKKSSANKKSVNKKTTTKKKTSGIKKSTAKKKTTKKKSR